MNKLKEEFLNPNNETRPRLRYWWPGGYPAHYLEELEQEIKSIATAGFGGVEIANVYDGLSEEACLTLQPKEYGFTSENWKKSVKHTLKAAKKFGIKVDLTVGPHWPATTNEATPNEVGTAKELVYGTNIFSETIVKGTKIEKICPIHYQTSQGMPDGREIENHLVGLYVADHFEHAEVEVPPAVPWEEPSIAISDKINFHSLKEITNKVQDGELLEAITPDTTQILIAIYQRGTGQRVNMFTMVSPTRPDVMDPFAFVVDHFSKEGAELVKKLWEKNFLCDPEFVDLLKEVGDCFFEDSLELQSVGHWTDKMLVAFEEQKGYSIKPYLPFVLGINQDKGLAVSAASFQVEEENKEMIQKFRHDYFEVLNYLYQSYHLETLKTWANELGMKYRAQPYGWAIDSAAAATYLDVVEGESLGFGEEGNDAFRLLAAGRDFGGLEILSDEAGAYLFQGYATTLAQLFTTLHKNFLAGVNQTYWHGYPFKYAPQAKWPGFAAFSPMFGGRGFAEAWGERQPVWEFMNLYTTYQGRVQRILRHGKNQTDLLVYQAGHNASENKNCVVGEALTKLGLTYQVMTEGLFNKGEFVENSKLVVKGGSYRGLVIPNGVELSSENQERIKQWRNSGLPVFELNAQQNLSEVTNIFGESLFKEETGALLTYQRVDENHRFIICYNQGEQTLSLQKFLSEQNCLEWSPWSGKVDEVTTHELHPNELRIFERLETKTKGPIQEFVLNKKESLKTHPWQFTVESWEMLTPDELETKRTKITKTLDELSYWNQFDDLKNVSGVGTYTTSFTIQGEKPKKIWLPGVQGSLVVQVNDQTLMGNPFTGYYELDEKNLKEENDLMITVASTLNNYLNNCPLTEYYGTYEPQNYGVEAAFLIY